VRGDGHASMLAATPGTIRPRPRRTRLVSPP
jgi:hypothetical protein